MKYIFVILLLLNGCGFRTIYDTKKNILLDNNSNKSIIITKSIITKFDKKLNDFLILKNAKPSLHLYTNIDNNIPWAFIEFTKFQYTAIDFDSGIYNLHSFCIDLEYDCDRKKNPIKHCVDFCLIDSCHCDPCFLEYNEFVTGSNIFIPYEERDTAYASFATNPNEIVYIGDLAFTENGLEYLDSYEEAKQWFYKEYPQFKDKPVIKRIATLGPYAKNISIKK